MKKKYKLVLVILWMILIFIMSSFNATESNSQSSIIVNFALTVFNIKNISLLTLVIRKLAHFSEYLVLGLLIYNYFKDCDKKIYSSILICFAYAISDEIHQLFVSGRSFQIGDIIIDTIGAIIGILMFYLIKNKSKILKKC